MRKEDIVKLLMIYHNDFSNKFKNSLNKRKKEELEEEVKKIDLEKLKEKFLDTKVYKIYADLVFKGKCDEDFEIKDKFILIEEAWGGERFLPREVREFLREVLPKPKGYEIEYIECRAKSCNYVIKEYVEAIKNMKIEIGQTNKVKKSDINRVKKLFNSTYTDEEISWIIFVAVKYFKKHKKFDFRKFYDFIFYRMNIKDEVALFRMILFSVEGIRYKNYFDNIFDFLWKIFRQCDKCVTIENLQKYIIYRNIGVYFYPYDINELSFKQKYLRIEPFKLVGDRMKKWVDTFNFYEEYTLQLFKGFADFLSVIGLLELDIKENDTIIDVFYGRIYVAKLSNIGLWYGGYTNHLKLPTIKKSTIKTFNKILAIMFDEDDVILKAKIDRFFTKKGKFYFLDDEKILKGIKNKNELKARIKEIEEIINLPKHFKNHLDKLLKEFKEIKKVDMVVLEVDKESLKVLNEIRDLFLLAEDSKIIVKDFNRFKKEAERLGVVIN